MKTLTLLLLLLFIVACNSPIHKNVLQDTTRIDSSQLQSGSQENRKNKFSNAVPAVIIDVDASGSPSDSLKYVKVVKMIARLPEVVEENKDTYTESKGSWRLAAVLDNDPKKDGYYLVTIYGQDTSHRTRLYSFTFNPKTHALSYNNIMPDTTIPYETWRRSLEKSKSSGKYPN